MDLLGVQYGGLSHSHGKHVTGSRVLANVSDLLLEYVKEKVYIRYTMLWDGFARSGWPYTCDN